MNGDTNGKRGCPDDGLLRNTSCRAFGRLRIDHVAANDEFCHIRTVGHGRGEDDLRSRTSYPQKVLPSSFCGTLLYVGLPWFSQSISGSKTSSSLLLSI